MITDFRLNEKGNVQINVSGKWYQDTFYITNDFKEFLLNAYNK